MLQDVLAKGMQSIRTTLKKELLQHPSQINLKTVSHTALNNDRSMWRSRGITAEIRKNLRERPVLTEAELKENRVALEKLTKERNYRFNVIDVSNVPTSKEGLVGSITIRNSGRKEISENETGEIWFKVSFVPKVGEASIFRPDETESSSFMEWYFRVDGCNLQYYDEITIGIDFHDVPNADKGIGLSMLRAGGYYLKFGLLKGSLVGGYGDKAEGRIISAVFDSEKEIIDFKNNTADTHTEFMI